MTDLIDELPSEIVSKVLQCLREVDGEYEVQDMKALVDLIVEYGSKYPALYSLVSINEEAIALLRFQRAYQGAARFLTVVDRLLETLINSV